MNMLKTATCNASLIIPLDLRWIFHSSRSKVGSFFTAVCCWLVRKPLNEADSGTMASVRHLESQQGDESEVLIRICCTWKPATWIFKSTSYQNSENSFGFSGGNLHAMLSKLLKWITCSFENKKQKYKNKKYVYIF